MHTQQALQGILHQVSRLVGGIGALWDALALDYPDIGLQMETIRSFVGEHSTKLLLLSSLINFYYAPLPFLGAVVTGIYLSRPIHPKAPHLPHFLDNSIMRGGFSVGLFLSKSILKPGFNGFLLGSIVGNHLYHQRYAILGRVAQGK